METIEKPKVEITTHALEKFMKRIRGYDDQYSVNQELLENGDRYKEQIMKLYNHSELIYEGDVYGKQKKTLYYLSGKTALVVVDGSIITLYDLKFKFPDDVQETIINSLKKEILELGEKSKEMKEGNKELMQEIKTEISNSKLRINDYKELIEFEEANINFLKAKEQNALDKLTTINREIEGYANQLFGITAQKIIDK